MIRSKGFGLAVRSGLVGIVLAALPCAATAQNTERPLIYTNKTVFQLPVRIDDRHRGGLREIRLYVKCGAGDWARQETGAPDVKHFSYRVPQDGEFWFSVATVDQAGQPSPVDINREPPGLRVLVDTNPPIVDLKPALGADGKAIIKCTMHDANPDFQSLRLCCRALDGREQILVPDVATPGAFVVPNVEVWSRPIQVEAKDRCGNITKREFQLQNPIAQATPPQMPPPSPPLTAPPPQPIESIAMKSDLSMIPNPDLPPQTSYVPPPAAINPIHDAPPLPTPHAHETAPLALQHPPADAALTQVVATQSVPNLSAAKSTRPTNAARRLLNTTRAALEYRIDDVGPSGVSKVEVWLTGDEGRTWRRLQDDFDRRSPAEVNLPGEGSFGIRLAVTNGNGFGGTPPKAGDEPTSAIEVDTTTPFVQLRDIDPVTKGGMLAIGWTANDRNLSGEPVSLYFRTRRDAPWQLMAVNLANSGTYQWTFPRQLGAQFFIKIEVRDDAGNIARAETSEPVTLDLAEPRASVVGVTGISGNPVP